MANLLELQNVRRSFPRSGGEELLVLDDVNLTLKEGEIDGLLGRSGSGKSTLLRLIAGLARPQGGSLTYMGAPIEGPAQGVAMVFQGFALFPWMTVLENVMLGCRTPLGESVLTLFLRPNRVRAEEKAARERAMEVLEFFGLAARAEELAEDLAYPEQKLLSMARIFATDAQVLLLDEPTSGLDTDSLGRIVPMVRRLVERGKTVLLIEHNMELIAQLSDEVVFLHEGRVLARGKADQITRDPALTEIYFGV